MSQLFGNWVCTYAKLFYLPRCTHVCQGTFLICYGRHWWQPAPVSTWQIPQAQIEVSKEKVFSVGWIGIGSPGQSSSLYILLMLSCINGSKSLPKVSKIVKKLPCKVETVIVVDYLSNVYPSSYPASFLTAYPTKVTAHKPIPALTDTRYILGRSLVHRWANSERQAFTARTNLDSQHNMHVCV